MSTTLTNGLKLPDKGSVDWYADMQNNYSILDGAVGTVAEHTSQIAGKAPLVHTHTKSDVTDLFNSANTWTGDNTFSGSNSFNSGLTINNAASLNAVLQNAVKGDASTTGDFAIFIKDKVNGNAATSLLAVYRGGQDSGGSYAQINIDTKGNDNTRYNNSIIFRINPADNSNNAVFIPQRDKTIDLGSSSYQWNNLYAQSYYYNGTAWGLDKENVWSANQKILNNPSYLYLKNTSMTMGTAPASNKYSGVIFQDSNNTELGNVTYKKHKNSNNVLFLDVKNTNGTNNYECSVNLVLTPSGSGSFYPEGVDCNLGQASTPWKTLNGVNPGALSLPDTLGTSGTENVNYFNVIGYLNNTGTPATIPTTATYDGWLYINAKDGAGSYITVDDNPSSFGTSVYGNNGLGSQSVGLLCLICPIRAGHSYSVRIKSDEIVSARIYPAQGNV